MLSDRANLTVSARRAIPLLLVIVALGQATVACAWDEKSLMAIARNAVRCEVEGKPQPAAKGKSPSAGVFVTIERKGNVVGCRGGLVSRCESLEAEVATAARAAARHDARYTPLTPSDLRDFLVTVTIVQRLEPITDVQTLQPADGLVLRCGEKVGVVLPWEGKDPAVRLKWAYKKAGVEPGTACVLQRMKAERFRG
jgi:AMMECR1 domain-containing protein